MFRSFPHSRRSRALALASGALAVVVAFVMGGMDDARAQKKRKPNGRGPEPAASASASPTSEDSRLTEKIQKLSNAVRHYGGKLGVSVVDVRTGRAIAARDETLALNPASNAKLVTAWAALKALGPHHRYLTGLYGKIREDRVDTLVLRGEGDPNFEHGHLYAMVADLRRAGVRMVGDIVVDQSRFDDQQVPPAFEQQPDEWASFRAPVSATALDGNTVHVSVYPGFEGQMARVQVVPPSAVDVAGAIVTADEGTVESVQVEMMPLKEGRVLAQVSGSIPEGALPITVWRRVDDPAWLAGHALGDVCRELGIDVHGKVRRGHPIPQDLLAFHRSEPVAKLLFGLGKHSDNFQAEMVFKGLGGRSGPASFEAARMRVTDLLLEARVEPKGVKLSNGSGLFDADRMSASFLTSLLVTAAKDPSVAPEYIAQLAIGGVDGTLRNRFQAHTAARSIRAKTGTLRMVSALSGYVLGSDGQPWYAFALLANEVPDAATALREPLDEVVGVLAENASTPAR